MIALAFSFVINFFRCSDVALVDSMLLSVGDTMYVVFCRSSPESVLLVESGTMDLRPPFLDIASSAFIANSPIGVFGSGLGMVTETPDDEVEVKSPSKDAGGANTSSYGSNEENFEVV